MYTAIDLSKYIVSKCIHERQPISNLQLQKILYYIQKDFLSRGEIAFSDDIDYVRNNFGWVENLYIVSGNIGGNSYRDMQLMSLCAHNINANSTFSFWGAYLNRNPNKIVIAPRRPVNRCKYPFACEGWIMM